MLVATTDRTGNREDTNSIVTAKSIWAERLEAAGRHSLRYDLVLVLLWIGGMKFTAYEAEGIAGLVANSPLMSWAYQLLGTQPFSAAVGVAEIFVAVLIALRPYSARMSVLGSLLASGMFLTTLSFMLSTPGVVVPSLGFPILSVVPGQFLLTRGPPGCLSFRSTAPRWTLCVWSCRPSPGELAVASMQHPKLATCRGAGLGGLLRARTAQ
jgi:uncharacterized membrane protein YkgB